MINKKYCYPKVEIRAKQFRRKLVDKMTRFERITLKYLRELDYRIEIQKIVFYSRGKFYIADFYLPDYKIVIEVDGKQHNFYKNRMRDDLRTHRLKKSGVRDVLRFSNEECKKGEYFLSLLKDSINQCIKKHY